jgi:predicted GIY-YIG superfamily endonuclease
MNAQKSEHRELRLAYYEAHASETDARARERRLKYYGNVKQLLKKRIMRSLEMV